jgi:parvulin-like peptidyl-prolyl isomerase
MKMTFKRLLNRATWAILLLAAFAGVISAQAAGVQATAPDPKQPTVQKAVANPVLLTVKDVSITEQEFNQMLTNLPMQQQREFAQPGGRRMFADYLARLLALSQAGEKEGLDRQPDVAAHLLLARIQVMAFLEQETVRSRIQVTDEEVQKFYEQNKNALVQLHLLHISVPLSNDPAKAEEDERSRKQLAEVRARAARGEDFMQLAREFSKDSDAAQGGNLGFLGRGKLGDAMDSIVFRLRPGQISDVFDGPGSIHIFKALAERPQPLAEARPAIVDLLKGQVLKLSIASLLREMQPAVNEEYFAKEGRLPSMTIPGTVQVERNGKPVGPPVPIIITPTPPEIKK